MAVEAKEYQKEQQISRLYYFDAAKNAKTWRVLKCRSLPGQKKAALSQILAILKPADESPAISELANGKGFAVEAVVPGKMAAELVFALQAAKAAVIVVQDIKHFVP
ncbi:MAG: hypothetical protein A3J65_00245 [Candidatus Buchananbacteria bacterium RIFCSPHIGHO2_02_FULL_45_11b]|uniref:Histidine biosynthesis HisG C-terminal domain-containing protein n=4 Tax=Candidatus Buchananiibacteriota TaxID=1817903 RepID=A0A1G1YM79_9BACT|nr:MAG: hypothetical protein A2663_01795 [Candidatus Buchananbacteria bacterium RIFCSPHIGHO2_01_FULL_46_12]OGY52683.1 MAG: hypothetical protein A3J65_00245 [Candidatus Buchananbacteria bacterium RIFCSPHIGHO2_02_FULL_45_11b]OGY52916.1 MAG: hypothetical protein A3B15_02220 [Candidatus Buchananbacteria bacterium RIFCSPLOWO2_01_FULL_45_31]OGY56854.1 MAG: hypothetical protein A3H67_01915 [Candidatus Buchananbacteria bacterium RIFCSPLOWO2_02_FULL_46_11b]